MSTTLGPTVSAAGFNSTTATPVLSKEKIAVGVLTCIFGNLLISIALNTQKHAHNKIKGSGTSYVKSPTWWIGMALMFLGEFLNFAAYGFAHTGLIATLGSSGVIFNAIIAVIFLKEKLRLRDVAGTACAVLGAFLLVFFTERKEMTNAKEVEFYLRQPSSIALLAAEVVLLIILLTVLHFCIRKNPNVVLILLPAALLGSLTVISAKALSSMLTLTITGNSQLKHPILYIALVVMATCTIGQLKYINHALSLFDASVVAPINFIFFSVAAFVSGVVFYQEFWTSGPLQLGMSVLGALISFVGVALIGYGRGKKDEDAGSEENEKKTLLTDGDASSADELDEKIEGKKKAEDKEAFEMEYENPKAVYSAYGDEHSSGEK